MKFSLIFIVFFFSSSIVQAKNKSETTKATVLNVCGSDNECRTTVENIHRECYLGPFIPEGKANAVWNRPCSKAASNGVIWAVSGVSHFGVHVGIINTQNAQEVDVFLRPLIPLVAYNLIYDLYFDDVNPRLIRVDVNTVAGSTVKPFSFIIFAPFSHCRPCLKYISTLNSVEVPGTIDLHFAMDQKCATAAGMPSC